MDIRWQLERVREKLRSALEGLREPRERLEELRERLKEPKIMIGVGSAAILLIICAFFLALCTSGGLTRTRAIGGVVDGRYYTADEGKTWVADHWALATPFEKDGKTWVRVWLFTYDDKTGFPVYLEKLSPEAAAEVAKAKPNVQRLVLEEKEADSLLVKRVGVADAQWVPKNSNQGIATITPPEDPARGTARPLIPNIAK